MPGQTLRTVRSVAESLFEVRTALKKTLCFKTPYAVQALKTFRSAAERHKTPHTVQARKTEKGGCQGFLTSFSGCTAPFLSSASATARMSYRPECACEFLALGFSLFLFRLLLVVVGCCCHCWCCCCCVAGVSFESRAPDQKRHRNHHWSLSPSSTPPPQKHRMSQQIHQQS